MDTCLERKRAWKSKHQEEAKEISGRSQRIGESITELAAAIQQERADCLEHAAAETEPLRMALKEHDEHLRNQKVERKEEVERFTAEMQSRFSAVRFDQSLFVVGVRAGRGWRKRRRSGALTIKQRLAGIGKM